jgi:hypothetical protein
VAALAGPKIYTLTLPRHFRCSPTVNVDLLSPSLHPARPARLVADPGQEGKHVVEQLLNCKTLCGRTYYLVRWQSHSSAEDSWEQVEHLVHCPERNAESYEAAAPLQPMARQAQQRDLALPWPALGLKQTRHTRHQPRYCRLLPRAGSWRRGRAPLNMSRSWARPSDDDPLLVARRGLAAGARPTQQPQTPFTHVVGYRSPPAAFTVDVDSLLDDKKQFIPNSMFSWEHDKHHARVVSAMEYMATQHKKK